MSSAATTTVAENRQRLGQRYEEFSRVLSNFSNHTGMHSVSIISNEKKIVKKGIWSILLVAALFALGLQIHGIWSKLSSRPTSTKVEIVGGNKIMFPDITFCNLNGIKRNILDYISANESSLSDEVKRFRKSSPDMMENLITFTRRLDKRFKLDFEFMMDDNIYKMLSHFLSSLPPNIKKRFTYSLRESVLRCKIGSADCLLPEFFQQFDSPRFQNCFVFHVGEYIRSEMERNSTLIDRNTNVELTLYVNEESYIPGFAPGAGFVIVIHPHTSPPIPDEEGKLVTPGYLTHFGLKRREMHRLPYPYGKCKSVFNFEQNSKLNMFFKTFPQTQPTKDVCMRTCEQLQTMKRCRCYSSRHGYIEADAFNEVNNRSRKKPCLTSWTSVMNRKVCGDEILRNIREGNDPICNQMCDFEECITTTFEVTQSSAIWPDGSSIKWYLDYDGIGQSIHSTLNETNFRRNLLRVSISFDDLNVLVYMMEAMYGWIDFLSDLGGQGGLWLGISVFTVCEVSVMFIEMGTLILRAILRRIRRKWRRANLRKNGKSNDQSHSINSRGD